MRSLLTAFSNAPNQIEFPILNPSIDTLLIHVNAREVLKHVLNLNWKHKSNENKFHTSIFPNGPLSWVMYNNATNFQFHRNYDKTFSLSLLKDFTRSIQMYRRDYNNEKFSIGDWPEYLKSKSNIHTTVIH